MNSGYHNRNKKDRRDSPSSSNKPRAQKTYENPSNQRNRTPPKTLNGKMPSVASSPSSEPLSDGMAGMTLDNIRYPIGSKITAKLVTNETMKGEVVAFDPNFKIVIIKSASGRPGHHNVSIVNLSHCAEIKVDEEGKESPSEMQDLNTQRLQERLRTQIERKKKLITAFKAGISPEGQKLFQYINKTLDDVMWQGDKIQVMNKVVIEPPYKVENVKLRQGLKEDDSTVKNLNHVRKIVEKHLGDQDGTKSNASPLVSSPMMESNAAISSSRTSSSTAPPPSGALTTTIPNLPQAPAPPAQSSSSSSSHSSKPAGGGGGGGSRSNRNNAGRKQHHDHHPKPM